tara:strand:+ start:33529 stop:33840 length:312 start_codon:yes stop_codon:yes gene_type:complete
MSSHNGSDLNMQAVIAHSKGLVATDIDGEIAIMAIDSGKYHSLNATGSQIWNAVQQPQTVADLCESLASQYQVDEEQCRSDVLSYLQDMVNERLLEVSDAVAA